MWVFAFSCAFIAGVGFAATRDPAWAATLCPVLCFGLLVTRWSRATLLILVAGSLLAAVLGVQAYERSLPAADDVIVSAYNESGPVALEAIICEEPESGGRYTSLLLDNVRVTDAGRRVGVDGRVLLTTSDPRQFHYGDAVLFRGILETPRAFDGFDYPRYLALSGVYSTAFQGSLEFRTSDEPKPLRVRLAAANSALDSALARVLPEPEGSVARSLLLGRRGSLPDEVWDAFARTGTAHLLAISGLHLGIIVAAILGILLILLGRRYYLYVWIGLAALWVYALLTGMNPPVVRAAMMASTFLLAELAGRQKHAPTALAFAAAVMVSVDPRLLWTVSFQMSVLAMGGIVLLFHPLRALLESMLRGILTHAPLALPVSNLMLDVTTASLAATAAIWPISAGTFSQFSVVGVVVSLLTLPFLPFALASAAMTAVTALFSTSVAAPLAWTTWLLTTYIVKVIESFAGLPWASVTMCAPEKWGVVAYYVTLSAVPLAWHAWQGRDDGTQPRGNSSREYGRSSTLHYALPPLLLTTTIVWAMVLSAPDARLHVSILDVGQGDCIVVQSPSGRTVLIDGGPDGRRTCALVDGLRPFWDRTIDVVVATHPHADHLGGLLSVIQRYGIGMVVEPAIQCEGALYEEWRARVTDADCDVVSATRGQEMDLGDGTLLQILNPAEMPLSGTNDDMDNNGVVIRLTYGDVSFLFAADIRAEAERALTGHAASVLRSNVLKVPHHGSESSSSERFIAAVAPGIAVVSAGEDNPYGHPHPVVLERYAATATELLVTCATGTIEFVTDGATLWIQTENAARQTPS